MHAPDAVVSAVLCTLLRATLDARVPVVLRSHRLAQAQALARWLAAAHGSQRTVIASTTAPAQIEVRLPARIRWPMPDPGAGSGAGLAGGAPGHHLSPMNHPSPFHGPR